MTVIGVVADVKGEHLDAEPRQDFYIPHAQRETPRRELVIVLRTQGRPEDMVERVRREVSAWDPNQPISRVRPMEEVVLDSLGAKRLTLCLLSFFAVLALLLATVGIFAVLANAVSQRTREIGIRMAMGAQLQQVVRLFLGEGLKLTVIGIVAGLLIAAAASHAMASFVYGISTLDLPTFAGVALLFLSIAAVASYLPTRRAAKVDPTEALRYE
jgi:putative ABC transport system permease protein